MARRDLPRPGRTLRAPLPQALRPRRRTRRARPAGVGPDPLAGRRPAGGASTRTVLARVARPIGTSRRGAAHARVARGIGYPGAPMRGLDRILELQDLDTSIDRLEHRREQLEGGEELSSLRKEMEEADARLGELRLASDSISSESARLEHEIASMSDKLHAEEKRMYDGSIANAKELEALQHEIVSLKERRSRAEDELLEQMVRKEDVEVRAGQSQTGGRGGPGARRGGRRRRGPGARHDLGRHHRQTFGARGSHARVRRGAARALRRSARAEARRRGRRDRGRGVPGLPREALGRRARSPETHRGRRRGVSTAVGSSSSSDPALRRRGPRQPGARRDRCRDHGRGR